MHLVNVYVMQDQHPRGRKRKVVDGGKKLDAAVVSEWTSESLQSKSRLPRCEVRMR
jgi:hypothetical protein